MGWRQQQFETFSSPGFSIDEIQMMIDRGLSRGWSLARIHRELGGTASMAGVVANQDMEERMLDHYGIIFDALGYVAEQERNASASCTASCPAWGRWSTS